MSYEAKKAMIRSFGLWSKVLHLFLYAVWVRTCAEVTDALRLIASILHCPLLRLLINAIRRRLGKERKETQVPTRKKVRSATSSYTDRHTCSQHRQPSLDPTVGIRSST